MLVGGVMTFALAQEADDSNTRQMTIEIEVTEDGEVTKIVKEVDAADGQDIQEILLELDVLQDIDITGTGERLEIKVKKEIDGDLDSDIDVEVFAPGSSFGWTDCNTKAEKRALLGVFIEDYNIDGQKGAHVTGIVENSAAEKAGLKAGDVVTKVNGAVISTEMELREAIASHDAGEKVTVKYLRDGSTNSKKVELGESEKAHAYSFHSSGNRGNQFIFKGDIDEDMEKLLQEKLEGLEDFDMQFEFDEDAAFLGVTAGECSKGSNGVLLGKVVDESSAEKMGLKAGDRVMKLNGKSVNNFGELSDVIGSMKAGDEIKVEYERDGENETVTGNLGDRGQGSHGMNIMKFGYTDCNSGKGKGSGNELRVVKELNVVIEIKDVTEEDQEMLAKPADVDFDEELALNKIEFAPNPTDGQFKLEFELPEEKNTRVLVFDQMGRKVYEELLNNFDGAYSNQIDISTQPNGVYFLIIAQDQKQFTKKIVKQ